MKLRLLNKTRRIPPLAAATSRLISQHVYYLPSLHHFVICNMKEKKYNKKKPQQNATANFLPQYHDN